MDIELRLGAPGDALIAAERALRFKVLAEPFGLRPEDVRFAFEDESVHVWALRGEQLIGCVLFIRQDEAGGRLYQMAVEPAVQGSGVGRMLVERLEARLRELGVHEVRLRARDTAIGFYLRLGYRIVGEPFVEVGIEHRHMQRSL